MNFEITDDTTREELVDQIELLQGIVKDKTNAETQHLNKIKTLELKAIGEHKKALALVDKNSMLLASPEVAQEKARMEMQLEQAKVFIQSGAFPKGLNEYTAYTLIKAGEEMGLSPIESLNGLYIVNGKTDIWGKCMVSILTKNGYKIQYANEDVKNDYKEGTVTVLVTKDDESYSYTANTDEQVIRKKLFGQGQAAAKFSLKNKLRFHGVRMILNFNLPHLLNGASDLFTTDYQNDIVEAKDNKTEEWIEMRNKIESFNDDGELVAFFEENKSYISKNIGLMQVYGSRRKKLQTGQVSDAEIVEE